MSESNTESAVVNTPAERKRVHKATAWTADKARKTQDYSAGRILWWVILVMLGFAINTGLERVVRAWTGPDAFLAKIYEDQTNEFEKLQKGLGDLRKELPAGHSGAFATVENAVTSLRESNKALLNQLGEAKQRNQRLSKNLAAAGAAQGGYDFILDEGGGIRVDGTTYVGLERVSTSGRASVNLTSRDSEERKNYWLDPGEALNYQSSDGRPCKIVVLSINGASDTATFDTSCAESPAS